MVLIDGRVADGWRGGEAVAVKQGPVARRERRRWRDCGLSIARSPLATRHSPLATRHSPLTHGHAFETYRWYRLERSSGSTDGRLVARNSLSVRTKAPVCDTSARLSFMVVMLAMAARWGLGWGDPTLRGEVEERTC